jgi:anti-sigma factor RsiW
MTDLSCGYGDDREAAIVAFLYGEADANPSERSAFEAHMRTCARCQADVASLGQVRVQLGAWSPPEPSFGMHNSQSPIGNPQSAIRSPQSWWRAVPAWAQVAAALLFLGVSAGLANLDIQYRGLTIRTGWSPRAAADATAISARSADPAATAPWRTDLSALERQLKSEIQAMQSTSTKTVAASPSDVEVSRRVRAMVDESEKRQQRELALRIAELARDVTAQRQADMVKIDRTLGLVQNNVGIEVMKTREKMNQMDLIYRASQQRQ